MDVFASSFTVCPWGALISLGLELNRGALSTRSRECSLFSVTHIDTKYPHIGKSEMLSMSHTSADITPLQRPAVWLTLGFSTCLRENRRTNEGEDIRKTQSNPTEGNESRQYPDYRDTRSTFRISVLTLGKHIKINFHRTAWHISSQWSTLYTGWF